METYKVIFKAGETQGVYGISLVESPAMESQFIALASQEPLNLKAIDTEKRILLGAVLIPDKPIYRNQGGKEFNIVFPAETIRLTSENYHRQGYQNNSTLEHNEEMKLSGVTFVESWIKEDMINDKSAMHGFNEPIGTWYASMKVDSDEVWNDFVKTGKVKGFSIDGLFDLEKINLKSESNMEFNLKAVLEAIKEGFANKGASVKLGSIMTQDQSLKVEFEGDTLAKDTQVFIMAEDGTQMPVPDGEYILEDGMTIVVVSSLVTEIKEPAQEDATAELEADTTVTTPTVKSEKHTQEVFYQLSKSDTDFLTELSIDGANSKDMKKVATILNALVEYNFGWQIREKQNKTLVDDAISAYGMGLAKQFGKELESIKVELKKEFETKQEVISLTKQKEVSEVAPKNAKERIQAKLNQTKK